MEARRIAGRYELVEQLGTSSWRAVDTDLGRDVLIRMPGRDASAAGLTHHAIVPLFDQGEEDGVPYAVYEYLAGGSLERRIAVAPLGDAEAGRSRRMWRRRSPMRMSRASRTGRSGRRASC